MSVEKRFRRCVDPCQCCLTLDDTHDPNALCVWAKSTRALFSREWSAFIVSLFSVGKSSALGCPVLGRSSAPRGSGPAAAEAVKRLSSRRSQIKLANEFEREKNEFFISRSTAADESELREEDVLSVTSSGPAGSALLAHGALPAM